MALWLAMTGCLEGIVPHSAMIVTTLQSSCPIQSGHAVRVDYGYHVVTGRIAQVIIMKLASAQHSLEIVSQILVQGVQYLWHKINSTFTRYDDPIQDFQFSFLKLHQVPCCSKGG